MNRVPFATLLLALPLLSPTESMSSPWANQEPSHVPAMAYRLVPDFFKLPANVYFGEVSGVALNSKGHIFVFNRGRQPLVEFDSEGKYLRTIGEGLFTKPHGLRIDSADNIWTTDVGSHTVLKLSPEGRILMVLGQKEFPAEDEWHFHGPTDVAFGKSGEIFVSDGDVNSRIVKLDRNGRFLKAWGRRGSAKGEFNVPHGIAIDGQGLVYVGDRENKRIQIFDADGNFIREWTHVGHPYGLFISADRRIFVADAVAGRILELDADGRVLGEFGVLGRAPGEFAGAHAVAVGPGRELYVAEVFNWRAEKFVPVRPSDPR